MAVARVEMKGGAMIEAGQTISNRYKVLRHLGRGGMGTTWEAEDVGGGGRVAIKVLSMRSLESWKALELFEREARVLASLDHPAIPRFIDSVPLGQGEGFCLIQALIEGRSLDERRAAGWSIDEAEVRRIAREVLEILVYLQARTPPVIHRDIKPQNILIRPDGALALVDFGAVRDAAPEEGGHASTVVGTFGTMAPEQLQGRAGPASDLYGLGATLVFLLTGKDPSALPQVRLRIDFRAACEVSAPFGRWLDRMIEPAPEDRLPTARAALDALDDLNRGGDSDEGARPPAAWVRLDPPAGSLIRQEERGGRLELTLPASGLRRASARTMLLGALSVFWLGFAAFWIKMAGASPSVAMMFGPLLLAAGFWNIWIFLRFIGESQHIEVDDERFALERRIFGRRLSRAEGLTRDIGHVGLSTIQRLTRPADTIRVELGVQSFNLGHQLSAPERSWLLQRLGAHVAATRRAALPAGASRLPLMIEDAAPAEQPEEAQASASISTNTR